MIEIKRKCIKVISGNKFVIDKPICNSFIVKLKGVGNGDIKQRKKLAGLIEGRIVDIKDHKVVRMSINEVSIKWHMKKIKTKSYSKKK